MEVAETKVRNRQLWYIAWALIIVGALMAGLQAIQNQGPKISWRYVPMDGHRIQSAPVNASNIPQALGVFEGDAYVAPSGARYAPDSPVAEVARELIDAQSTLAPLKIVIGHSSEMLLNLRTDPDLPLGNLVADALRDYGSRYFKVPMDFAITNFGGIRIPMPEGDVTLEDIDSMFPFKNYVCWCKMTGASLLRLFNQLALTQAFQAISGATVRVKDHKVESALIGGKEIDPARVYNVTTIDFLLDGGDQLNIGALSEDVVLTHVLLRDVMLDYVRGCEARGEKVSGRADGRVIMED